MRVPIASSAGSLGCAVQPIVNVRLGISQVSTAEAHPGVIGTTPSSHLSVTFEPFDGEYHV